MSQTPTIPKHVGIILDGNRRWAKKQGLSTLEGHKKGAENLRTISVAALESGVQFLSAFVFSTENWRRSKTEVNYLMRLIVVFLGKYLKEFEEREIKILFSGSREGLPKSVLDAMDTATEATKRFAKGTLILCVNYGGQQEIVDAAKKLLRERLDPVRLTAQNIASRVYNPEVPDVDLIIRTSGENRTSGFMLWRAAYAEIAVVEKYWPDFTKQDLRTVLSWYAKRQRRFGS